MMKEAWVELFRQEIHDFAADAEAFAKGELSRKDYKGRSGGFGSYAQHDADKHMLRLRMSAGHLTRERLAFLAKMEQEAELMKLTTCESVQLHGLTAAQLPVLMEQAIDAEIYTRGGGGDNPRNIMMSPLSGVQQGECFDVLPYAEAAGEYLLSICRDIKMPRKLKVAFCNGADDSCHAAFRDMGFIAQTDGTFRLIIAGGLGGQPRMGLPVVENLPAHQILYAIRAMIETFCQHGNYTDRSKARTRFMQETLGQEGLKKAFLENFQSFLDKGGLDCYPDCPTVTKQGEGTLSHPRAIAQKQTGLYAVSYHPIGGWLPLTKPAELLALLKDMPEADCRIGPDETMYIVNLTAAEAEQVLAATEDGAKTDFERSVACVGCTVCQQGVRDSRGLLMSLVEKVREAGLSDTALPTIAISGCPSSCAAPQSAVIGLMGGVKNVDGAVKPAYKLSFGGSDALGKARFGESVGAVLEQDLPELLIRLGRAAEAAGTPWTEFAASEEAKAILADYI